MAKIGKHTYLTDIEKSAALASASVRLARMRRCPTRVAILGVPAGVFGPLTVK
jgi:hypothetical protein